MTEEVNSVRSLPEDSRQFFSPSDVNCPTEPSGDGAFSAPPPSENRTCKFPCIRLKHLKGSPCGEPQLFILPLAERDIGEPIDSTSSIARLSPLRVPPGIFRQVGIGVLRDLDIAPEGRAPNLPTRGKPGPLRCNARLGGFRRGLALLFRVDHRGCPFPSRDRNALVDSSRTVRIDRSIWIVSKPCRLLSTVCPGRFRLCAGVEPRFL